MILLLAHKRIVRIAKVESLVGVHPVMRHRQLLEIMIAKGMPGCLLKRMEPDALITGIDVIAVGDFVVVQHRATAAATVLHRTQFRFLKTSTKSTWHITITRDNRTLCSYEDVTGVQIK